MGLAIQGRSIMRFPRVNGPQNRTPTRKFGSVGPRVHGLSRVRFATKASKRIEGQVGFIGVGNMGKAMLTSMLGKGLLPASRIFAFDTQAEAVETLSKLHKIHPAKTNRTLARKANILILAVKPNVVAEVGKELRGELTERHLIISIVAGKTTEVLRDAFGKGPRIIRAMPNTPLQVGLGATVLCSAKGTPDADLETAKTIFEASGIAFVLPENRMDAVTAISGSGPAYFFYIMQSIIEIAVRLGLPLETATPLVLQTALGAATLANEKDAPVPAELRRRVTSPGGTTEAAFDVISREGQLKDILREALEAAMNRSIELGKKT